MFDVERMPMTSMGWHGDQSCSTDRQQSSDLSCLLEKRGIPRFLPARKQTLLNGQEIRIAGIRCRRSAAATRGEISDRSTRMRLSQVRCVRERMCTGRVRCRRDENRSVFHWTTCSNFFDDTDQSSEIRHGRRRYFELIVRFRFSDDTEQCGKNACRSNDRRLNRMTKTSTKKIRSFPIRSFFNLTFDQMSDQGEIEVRFKRQTHTGI